MESRVYSIAQTLVSCLSDKGRTVATAESCTGGGVAAALTAIPGSSACVKGGIVAYTEEVKMRLLGVSANTLKVEGVVSEQTVLEMARGVMKVMDSDFTVATSGVAGPSGGTETTPIGTIWIAAISKSYESTHCIRHFDEGRAENTRNAVLVALEMLQKLVEKEENQR